MPHSDHSVSQVHVRRPVGQIALQTLHATSMMSSYSSSATIATSVAYDAMTENVNTNALTTTNTNASTMESVKSMVTNRMRLLPTNDTMASALASATAAAAYTSVDTMTAMKQNSADTTATKQKTADTTATKQISTATTATKRNSAATTATKSRSTATLKRKYDDSEDVSKYDDSEGDSEDDSDDDDDPPPPPKKGKHARSSEDSTIRIKKSVKAKLLQKHVSVRG